MSSKRFGVVLAVIQGLADTMVHTLQTPKKTKNDQALF